jgi:L-alanine-DL-glutamate epimerase-like enolase superfamily enzyme
MKITRRQALHVWLEDPMAVAYTESWKRLTEVSRAPICMGENLVFREQFMHFIINVITPEARSTRTRMRSGPHQ